MSQVIATKRKSKKRLYRHSHTDHWWDLHDKMMSDRKKNTVIVSDFPLIIRTKPTSHIQYCLACRMPINKGQIQIRMDAGLWHTYGCEGEKRQFKAYYDKIKIFHSIAGTEIKDWSETYYPRHVYLHINCLSCLLKKMFSKVGVPLSPNCDECEIRFNCYTNNVDIEESKPSYVPSHPCSREDNWMNK